MKKSIFVFIFVIIIVIIFLLCIFPKTNYAEKNNDDQNDDTIIIENEPIVNKDSIEIIEEKKEDTNNTNEIEKINEIKEQVGVKADSNLYEVDTEYDGREIINIKSSVQFKVAFAGLIKQKKPQIEEIETIIKENYPNKKGIWIEKGSRNKIIELIKSGTESNYIINEEGYLKIDSKLKQNDYDKIIEKLINGNKLIILSVASSYYEVDSVTGEIVEYPFEKLDNYQVCENIKSDNGEIIFITSNSNKKLTSEDILKELLNI